MSLNIKTLLVVLAVLVIAVAGRFLFESKTPATQKLALTTSSGEFTDGLHYRTLATPVDPSVAGDKISVREFFWYGCPHCRAFESKVKKWLQTIPADVDFEPLPVAWNDPTRLHAGVFYVARDAQNAEQLHDKLFDLIIDLRQERNPASQIEQIGLLLSEHGIDPASLDSQLKSSAIQNKVSESEQLMRQAEVSSTPAVMVDGRWVVLNNESVATSGVFAVIDHLIQKARAAR